MDTQDATPVEQRDIRFAGARLPWHLIHLETIGSTSDYLKQTPAGCRTARSSRLTGRRPGEAGWGGHGPLPMAAST